MFDPSMRYGQDPCQLNALSQTQFPNICNIEPRDLRAIAYSICSLPVRYAACLLTWAAVNNTPSCILSWMALGRIDETYIVGICECFGNSIQLPHPLL